MKNISILLLLLTCFAASAQAQRNERPVEIRLMEYLSGYCEEGETLTFFDFIRQNQQAAEPLLMKYAQEGVPREKLQAVQEQARTQFGERQKVLESGLDFGLSEEDLKYARNENLEVFSGRQVQDFRDGFMAQIFFGLAIVDSPAAREAIERVANDSRNPDQGAAINARNQVHLRKN